MLTYLEGLDGERYMPFNLLFGDGARLAVAYVRPGRLEVHQREPGITVLANDRLGSPRFPKAARAQALLGPLVEEGAFAIERLGAVLADDVLPPLDLIEDPAPAGLDRALLQRLQAICIRTASYGTRSSAIVAIGSGTVARYLVADGPPDEAPFVDRTRLFESPAAT